ncbi:hypothetical protein I5M32_07510 [Pedobacter sp. SD-b]|uniref:Lipoprotein n=1 Tax=Pedobacter segetis TaxID=2793069 RepID=A0ABS1BIT8_9SPHI|nr:hypothetical protein [Pedobacter segetis]
MKKTPILAIPLSLLILASCNSNNKRSGAKDSLATFNKQTASCYRAISNTDTATLSFDQKDAKVVGELAFNFKDKDDSKGTISGEFKGDTLFVDYTFKLKGADYKNPQVFLKRGDELVQGSGELEMYLGRTYFKKGAPINFENGFVFEPINCK